MWANFMGPMTLLPVLARSLRIAEAKLRVIVPRDIGGSFGIKSSLFPYMTVVGLLAMRAGRPVKWVEDRAEHLIGSSHQPDRVGTRELALTKDGEIIGLRAHVVDNLGAYVRAPEPATTYRPLGNYVGPYRVRDVELHLVDVVSNKVPTGPNRGYGCQQVYLETERTLDEAAVQLGLDPGRDPPPQPDPGGRVPVRDADRRSLRQRRLPARPRARARDRRLRGAPRGCRRRRAPRGGWSGSGSGSPSIRRSRTWATSRSRCRPEVRQAPGYNPKSGAADWAQVRVDPRRQGRRDDGDGAAGAGPRDRGRAGGRRRARPHARTTSPPSTSSTATPRSGRSRPGATRAGSPGSPRARRGRSAGVVKRQILEIGATPARGRAPTTSSSPTARCG